MWKVKYRGRDVAVKALKVSQSSKPEKIRRVGHYPAPSSSVNGGADGNCVEFLQGSYGVEKSPPSKRAPIFGGENERLALRNGIGVDVQWEHQRIYQEE